MSYEISYSVVVHSVLARRKYLVILHVCLSTSRPPSGCLSVGCGYPSLSRSLSAGAPPCFRLTSTDYPAYASSVLVCPCSHFTSISILLAFTERINESACCLGTRCAPFSAKPLLVFWQHPLYSQSYYLIVSLASRAGLLLLPWVIAFELWSTSILGPRPACRLSSFLVIDL